MAIHDEPRGHRNAPRVKAGEGAAVAIPAPADDAHLVLPEQVGEGLPGLLAMRLTVVLGRVDGDDPDRSPEPIQTCA